MSNVYYIINLLPVHFFIFLKEFYILMIHYCYDLLCKYDMDIHSVSSAVMYRVLYTVDIHVQWRFTDFLKIKTSIINN